MAEEIVIDSPAVTTSASSITRIDMDKDGVKLRAGSFISIGGRPYQEDRVVIIDDLNAFCEPCDAVGELLHHNISFYHDLLFIIL